MAQRRRVHGQHFRAGWPWPIVIAATLVTAAACGSTVQGSSSVNTGGSGLSVPSSSLGVATSGPGGVNGTAAVGGGGPAVTGTGAVPGAGASGVSAGSGAAVAAGSSASQAGGTASRRLVPAAGAPGVTDTSVTIGYEYIESGDFNSATGGVGLQGTAVGNTRAEAQAVIDYIDAHGGVAGGRKIVGLPYKQNPTDDAPTHDQAACSYYTEDNHAFAAMAIDDGMDACLHNHRAIAIASGYSNAIYRRYPHDVFAPGLPEACHAAGDLANRLYQYGYFDPGFKLGVMYDPGNKDSFSSCFVPALRNDNVSVADSAEVSEGSSTVTSDVKSVELRFAADGVNHVVILNSGLLAFVFMQEAQSQAYHPRYGLWSGNQESLLQEQAFARDQLPRSIGMGWSPGNDVDQAHEQENSAQQQCDAIMKARGLVAVSNLDHALQLAYCATFFFMSEALNTAASLDTLHFQAAVEALGRPTLSAALGYGEQYAPGKHWGTGAVRMTAFDSPCSCFVYRSGRLPV